LLCGRLARAKSHRIQNELGAAQADLDEVMNISMRGNMGLYQADGYLEFAQLYLVQGDKTTARESWEKAKEMIERMGYHRRNKDVEEIGEQLDSVHDG
jgi:hypothetical protein